MKLFFNKDTKHSKHPKMNKPAWISTFNWPQSKQPISRPPLKTRWGFTIGTNPSMSPEDWIPVTLDELQNLENSENKEEIFKLFDRGFYMYNYEMKDCICAVSLSKYKSDKDFPTEHYAILGEMSGQYNFPVLNEKQFYLLFEYCSSRKLYSMLLAEEKMGDLEMFNPFLGNYHESWYEDFEILSEHCGSYKFKVLIEGVYYEQISWNKEIIIRLSKRFNKPFG